MFSNDVRSQAQLDEEAELLLAVARGSVVHGLIHGAPLPIEPAVFPASLQEARACFVTLRVNGELRGCVGSLEARASLVVEAARNAYKSAFEDTRFPPFQEGELQGLETHVSILGPLEPLEARSEAELLEVLRPGVDGLVLRALHTNATFLPAVWSQLPEPESFVRALKRKAGLPEDAWSREWGCERFLTRDVG